LRVRLGIQPLQEADLRVPGEAGERQEGKQLAQVVEREAEVAEGTDEGEGKIEGEGEGEGEEGMSEVRLC